MNTAGLKPAVASAAHSLLYTFLLGSVSLEDSVVGVTSARTRRQADARFEQGLELIIGGIRVGAAQR